MRCWIVAIHLTYIKNELRKPVKIQEESEIILALIPDCEGPLFPKLTFEESHKAKHLF